jgi:hypothetical protein
MKKLLLVLAAMMSLTSLAQAQSLAHLDENRRREIEARNKLNGQGHLVPGQPHQPPYPGYNDVYGPAVTYRWLDLGTHKAQKLVDTNIHLSVRGQLVNEIFVTAQNNPVLVRSAIAYLSNGQAIELRSLLGNIHENRPVRTVLDYRNSLRVESIVLNVEAASLLGSRGKLNIQLGLAQ